MVALAIDRAQLRQDAKAGAYYVGGILSFVLMVGLIAEIWQVIDLLPIWVDMTFIVLYLLMGAYVAYNRYTVEETAGGSDADE